MVAVLCRDMGQINVPDAHARSLNLAEIIVAVIDTGESCSPACVTSGHLNMLCEFWS